MNLRGNRGNLSDLRSEVKIVLFFYRINSCCNFALAFDYALQVINYEDTPTCKQLSSMLGPKLYEISDLFHGLQGV